MSEHAQTATDSTYQNEKRPDEVHPAATGTFVDGCRVDLPANDVVESIEFERFFRINLKFGDLQGLATLRIDESLQPLQARLADTDTENLTENPETPSSIEQWTVPLSTSEEDWEAVRANLSILAKATVDMAQVQAATVGAGSVNIDALPLAFYMPFRQTWMLRGYTRGRLVNSFTLGPEEEQAVELFKWDRIQRSLETVTSIESEQATESSSTRRDTLDVARDVTRQAGFEATTSGKVGFQVGVVNADLNAGLTARAGVNEGERNTRGSIVEATSRSVNRVRTSRTLKVVESREFGQEERITRRIRNPNPCHTLTIAFFEILSNYRIETAVQGPAVQLVVLLESTLLSDLQGFDRRAVRTHETALRLALLDRTLDPGFEAARLLDERDRACDILCTGCSCGEESMPAAGPEWKAAAAAARNVGDAVRTLRTDPDRFMNAVPLLALLVPTPPEVEKEAVKEVNRHLFLQSVSTHASRLLLDLGAAGVPASPTAVSAAQVDDLARAISAVPGDRLPLLTYDSKVSSDVWWEIVRMLGGNVLGANLVSSKCGDLKTYNDAGLMGAIAAFSTAYDAWRKAQEAERLKNERFAELRRIAREERELRILDAFGLRDTAAAHERLEALLDHLNDQRNIDHYRFAVWNERSGATDETLVGLALAGWIDPTPVGIVGDQLAVPVRVSPGTKLASFYQDSIVDLVERFTTDRRDHILPTAALYAESIVGTCGACEGNVVEDRRLDLERKRAETELLRLEAKRLDARLRAKPPRLDLDPPPAATLEVNISRRRDRPGKTCWLFRGR
jgi:hypothetical protein